MNDPEFAQALKTVLRDLRAQCDIQPQVRADGEWTVLYAPDGSGQGISWRVGAAAPDRLADLADQVQDWAVEALWSAGEPAVWPNCPDHPNTHPLKATVVQDTAIWACPRTGTTVARIGELQSDHRPSADAGSPHRWGPRRNPLAHHRPHRA